MMSIKKNKLFISLIYLFIIYGCGFKVVDQNILDNYKITVLEISGDKRISYLLKNKLQSSKKLDGNQNELMVNINVEKKKFIKEKNVQNQITKYSIKLDAVVNFNTKDNLNGEFTITQTGEYDVVNRHTQTLDNERQLLKILTLKIEEKIISNLRLKLNDI